MNWNIGLDSLLLIQDHQLIHTSYNHHLYILRQSVPRLEATPNQLTTNNQKLEKKYKELVNIYDFIPSFWIDVRSTSSIQPLARFVTMK